MKNVAFTCDHCGKTIIVPAERFEAYKALAGWMGFIKLSSLYTDSMMDTSDKMETTFCSEGCAREYVRKLKDWGEA